MTKSDTPRTDAKTKLGMSYFNSNLLVPAKFARQLERELGEAAKMIEGFLECHNNDCECRKGYGLCVQCKEAALEFIARIKGESHDKE